MRKAVVPFQPEPRVSPPVLVETCLGRAGQPGERGAAQSRQLWQPDLAEHALDESDPVGETALIPASRHCGRVSSATRSLWENARWHMARAAAPHPCRMAPPVVLGTVTATQPCPERP
jgi:hypothetical protein